ncbi:MAG: PilZ domain-containing protein, partial [Bdellovibrionaceae bacterium]|nr:PilZ domain-containing protein [Pseudobdellovibrionaceae bacterium]
MEQARWFLLLDGQVTGPFADPDIETRLAAGPNEALIWGRGQSEWMAPDKWRVMLKALLAQSALENSRASVWKMRIDHKELTPMNLDELVEHLKDYTDLSPVRIWTEGFEEWKEVFQVQKVMEELGISRRTHPRVPIMGTLKTDASAGAVTAKVISISEGGIGVNSASGLQIGEKINAAITSPNLFIPIHANLEVVYVGADGYAGLRFLALPNEAK